MNLRKFETPLSVEPSSVGYQMIGGIVNVPLATAFETPDSGDRNTRLLAEHRAVKFMDNLRNGNTRLEHLMTISANQIAEIGGAATASYGIAKRMVPQSNISEQYATIPRQRGSGTYQLVNMLTPLTFNLIVPFTDMKRLWNNTTLLNKGTTTAMTGFDDSRNAMLLQGIKDFCLAAGLFEVTPDMSDDKKATDAYYSILETTIFKFLFHTNEYDVGTDIDDLVMCVDLVTYLNLTRAYTKFIGTDVSYKTLSSGDLGRDSVLGLDVIKTGYFLQNFPAGSKRQLNADISFDLRGINMMLVHKDNGAFPLSFTAGKVNPYIQDSVDTQILEYGVTALPTTLRPELSRIGVPTQPTQADILAAQNKLKVTYDIGVSHYRFPTTPVDLTNLTEIKMPQSKGLYSTTSALSNAIANQLSYDNTDSETITVFTTDGQPSNGTNEIVNPALAPEVWVQISAQPEAKTVSGQSAFIKIEFDSLPQKYAEKFNALRLKVTEGEQSFKGLKKELTEKDNIIKQLEAKLAEAKLAEAKEPKVPK